jgi:pimeloyl-ACP methyl ester carboxylesterase
MIGATELTTSDDGCERVVAYPSVRNQLPPVLLVHGAWHAAWCWKTFAAELAEQGYEVHYFSLPGHGGSRLNKPKLNQYSLTDYVESLSAEIDRIQPKPIVIGHSLGGALLQIYLQTHQLPAAVLMASIPTQGTLPLIMRIALRFPLALLMAVLKYKSEIIVGTQERVRALFYSPDNMIDVQQIQQRLGPESMKILYPLMSPRTFKKIRPGTPVYVIAGSRDKITSVSEQRHLAKWLSADLMIVDDQAHCLMLEPKYQIVARSIANWLQQKCA